MGYKSVKTYDATVTQYYYKNNENPTHPEDIFLEVESPISNLTSFTKALKDYKTLYIKEREAVESFDPMNGITTLEEYFSWMRELGTINRKYTKLPLDEPCFEINANTRAITIPAEFKKNGIAVQGDDLAEVVYFKIDRYFDYMDLNNCEIYIQWEVPKSANNKSYKTISPAYIRDIESEPGKLIFGWAIHDAITEEAGALRFAVHFFEWADPEKVTIENNQITPDSDPTIAYSFNTLFATVNIQPSIKFNPEAENFKIDDCGDRLIGRLENSEIVGGYAAAVPKFVKNIDANIEYDLDTASGQYGLLVQAFASDTGAISYVWKRQGLTENNEINDSDIAEVPSENVFVEAVISDNMDKTYSYYVKTAAGYDLYTGLIPPSFDDQDPDIKLFVKQSQCLADNYGIYWAVAENRITNSSASENSNKAIFPRPQKVVISKQPDANGILVEADELNYQYELKVESANTDGVLSYQWQKNENFHLNYIDNEADFKDIDGATSASYVAEEKGRYRVIVSNTRNKDTKSLVSSTSRITMAAEKPEFIDEAVITIYNVDELSEVNCPTIKLDPDVFSDAYTVDWYLSEDTDKKIISMELTQGIYECKFNPLEFVEAIGSVSEYGDNIEGSYYAIVTNNVNGSSSSTSKPDKINMFVIVK